MAAIISRLEAMKRIARGQCAINLGISVASSATTAAATTSNYNTLNLLPNSIGGTFGTTQASLAGPSSISGTYGNFFTYMQTNNTARAGCIVRAYKLGTLNLAATGNQFTHDAATFPVLRTDWNGASQPVNLIPFIHITTALTTTAAAFQLQTNAGTAGYTNQAGSSVIGTKTFTMPSATTALGSGFILKLENGDYAIRDINQIKVTTASATGTADVWGLELFDFCVSGYTSAVTTDNMNTGLYMAPVNPAVATSGTATSFLTFAGTAASSTVITGLNISILTT
jgi:hypothetical protein